MITTKIYNGTGWLWYCDGEPFAFSLTYYGALGRVLEYAERRHFKGQLSCRWLEFINC